MRERDPWRVLGALLAGAGVSAVAIVALLGPWLPDAQTFAGMWAMRATGRETIEVVARFVVAAAVCAAGAHDLPRRGVPRRRPADRERRHASAGTSARPSR